MTSVPWCRLMSYFLPCQVGCSCERLEGVAAGELDVAGVVVQQHIGLAVAVDASHAKRVDTPRPLGGQPPLTRLLGHFDLQSLGLLGGADPGLDPLDERVEVLTVAGSAFEVDVCRAVLTGLGVNSNPQVVRSSGRTAESDDQQAGDQQRK